MLISIYIYTSEYTDIDTVIDVDVAFDTDFFDWIKAYNYSDRNGNKYAEY